MRNATVVFGVVVALCLALLGWWVVFHLREADQLRRAGTLLEAGRNEEAARALGAEGGESLGDRARRRWVMFASEAAAFCLLLLIGVVFFYTGMVRERRLREERERFLTGATHELKTPLATLRLGLESLASGRLPQARRDEYLAALLPQVARLEKDIDNLLAAAGLRSGDRALQRRCADLAEAVQSVVEEMAPRFEAAGIQLRCDEVARVVTTHDPAALRIVVRNLLDNAIKYGGADSRVELSLRADGERCLLRVADNGLGMTAQETQRAFDELYRGPGKEHIGGAGLGLHLVRSLVERHGGRVTARSRGPGHGCEVTVELPLDGEGEA